MEFLSSVYEMVRMTLTREQLLAAVEQADTLEDALEADLTEHVCAELRSVGTQALRKVSKRKCCQE